MITSSVLKSRDQAGEPIFGKTDDNFFGSGWIWEYAVMCFLTTTIGFEYPDCSRTSSVCAQPLGSNGHWRVYRNKHPYGWTTRVATQCLRTVEDYCLAAAPLWGLVKTVSAALLFEASFEGPPAVKATGFTQHLIDADEVRNIAVWTSCGWIVTRKVDPFVCIYPNINTIVGDLAEDAAVFANQPKDLLINIEQTKRLMDFDVDYVFPMHGNWPNSQRLLW